MRNGATRVLLLILGACLAISLGIFSAAAQESGTGYLKVDAHPHSTGVFIDGKYVGPAANFATVRKYPVAAGEHEVVLSEPRYQDFSTKVKIEPKKTTTLTQALQLATPPKPPYGTLRIQGGGSKFDAIFLNGKFMGHLDEFNNSEQGLLINPGEYALKVVSPAGNTELEEQIKVEENKITQIHVGAS